MNMRFPGNARMPAFGVRHVGVILLLLAFHSSRVCAAASETASLDARLEHFEAQDGLEFRKLCKDILKIPCGLEEAADNQIGQNKETPPLSLSKTRPRDILDAIAGRLPGYRWAYRGGVINLEPRNRAKDVLSKKLGKVSIHGVSSFRAARMVFDQAKIPFAYQPKGGRFGPVDLELKNVTVREALNAIVKADGQVMWFFAHSPRQSVLRVKGTLSMVSWRKDGASPND